MREGLCKRRVFIKSVLLLYLVLSICSCVCLGLTLYSLNYTYNNCQTLNGNVLWDENALNQSSPLFTLHINERSNIGSTYTFSLGQLGKSKFFWRVGGASFSRPQSRMGAAGVCCPVFPHLVQKVTGVARCITGIACIFLKNSSLKGFGVLFDTANSACIKRQLHYSCQFLFCGDALKKM